MRRSRLWQFLTGLLLVALFLWLPLSDVPLVHQTVQRINSMVYDLRLEATLPPPKLDKRIVIVDIDEKSLHAEGHWPWPRDKLAHLVRNLFSDGAAVVAFDVMFAERERNSGEVVLRRLDKAGIRDRDLKRTLSEHLKLFDDDKMFADAMHSGDVVLGFVFHHRKGLDTGMLPPPLAVSDPGVAASADLQSAASVTGDIPILQRASGHAGFFSLDPDPDGVVRHAAMVMRYHGKLYPSLALETAKVYLLLDKVKFVTAKVGDRHVLEAIKLGNLTLPTSRRGEVVIPYRGREGHFPYVSATDVLHGTAPKGVLQNAIVLVGATAQGLLDLRATPVSATYPGVEAHANIIAGILDNRVPTEPSWAAGANFTVTLAVGLILVFLLPYLAPWALLMVTFAVGTLLVAGNFWAWSRHGLILGLAPPLLMTLALGAMNMAYGFLVEARAKRELKGMFGQYVPPALVEEMSGRPDAFGFQGESREMSVLFADIRSFTTISESLGADQLKEMLNRFFTPVTKAIFDHRGTIDKYVGDMVMAFWGAPLSDDEHAVHAVEAAFAMLEAVKGLHEEFTRLGFPPVEIGIGVNSGMMNVGDMGSEYRRAYTVLGDTVNLASRLEGTTRYYDVPMVVGETTYAQINGRFLCRELDRVRVKGKRQAVTVYEPVCPLESASAELTAEVGDLQEALALYRSRAWDRAEQAFSALHEAHPGTGLYCIYLERIAQLRQRTLGEEWDGVYDRRAK